MPLLRGLAAFAASRLAAAFFATFVDLRDVQLAIAFTRRCLCRQTSIDPCQDLLQVCKELLPAEAQSIRGLLPQPIIGPTPFQSIKADRLAAGLAAASKNFIGVRDGTD